MYIGIQDFVFLFSLIALAFSFIFGLCGVLISVCYYKVHMLRQHRQIELYRNIIIESPRNNIPVA